MVEEPDDVCGQRLNRHRAVGVGSGPVTLELDRDHLPARRKAFEHRPEIELDGHQATVEHDEWAARAVRLVVQLQAVHRCVRHAWCDAMRRPATLDAPIEYLFVVKASFVLSSGLAGSVS
jgi:hypothetical protein